MRNDKRERERYEVAGSEIVEKWTYDVVLKRTEKCTSLCTRIAVWGLNTQIYDVD